uniref:Uncharacterized protein n=1 Tax=Anopheles coluzzii TaxID=1518534 RepID=A0A8W7PK65_ANOCL
MNIHNLQRLNGTGIRFEHHLILDSLGNFCHLVGGGGFVTLLRTLAHLLSALTRFFLEPDLRHVMFLLLLLHFLFDRLHRGFIGRHHGLTGPHELYYSRARLVVLVSGIDRLGFGSLDRDAGNIAWLRRVAFCRRHVLRLRESSLTLTTQPGNDFRVRQIVARPAPGGRLDRSGSRGSNHHHTTTASHRRSGKFRRHRWCALFLIATLYAPILALQQRPYLDRPVHHGLVQPHKVRPIAEDLIDRLVLLLDQRDRFVQLVRKLIHVGLRGRPIARLGTVAHDFIAIEQ